MRFSKHNMCGTRIYDIWRDMRHRCKCPGMRNYKDYGGRGISVCDEWDNEDGFMNFYKWAMQNGYSDSLTIDRIDVDGNYEPENCRWADKSIQSVNKRNTGKCEYIGVSMHSNGSCYMTMLRFNGKVLFWHTDRSKNECAKARNDFIIKNNLPHPLNEIKEEYEDIRPHKNDNILFVAIDIQTGKAFENKSQKALAKELGISPQFIYQCCVGQRNSKKYIFKKEVR